MTIKLKTKAQIEKMRKAGNIVCQVLDRLEALAKPGVTTKTLDREADRMTRVAGAVPLFKGVPNPRGGTPFPASICTSIDHEVVHGIPSDDRVLQEGQIVSVDFGVRFEGFCGDAAVTFPVGQVSEKLNNLMTVTRESLEIAIAEIGPDVKWSQVAAKMQSHIEKAGLSVVTSFVGHGIGVEMHEDPKIPNFVSRELLRHDISLRPGMVLAIEPMVNVGGCAVETADDGWTVVTRDALPSAHFEHTVAVTENGALVLTDGEKRPYAQ